MSWTKRQFVAAAFEEIGIADYVYDLEPEQIQAALRKLEGMMGMWDSKGIQIGFPISANPETADLDTETNAPDSANEAIYTNLAKRIAPSLGKPISQETKDQAKYSYKELLNAAASPREMQLPSTMITGAGNKPWRDTYSPFVSGPDLAPLGNADNGDLIFRD
jgi:hypothetical protein